MTDKEIMLYLKINKRWRVVWGLAGFLLGFGTCALLTLQIMLDRI